MVAAQVILGLWATGLAVAAPQLDFGDSRSAVAVNNQGNIDQSQVVSDVVSALQPSIEAAIAEALSSLSSSSISSSNSGSNFGSNSGSSFSNNDGRFSSGLSSTGGAAAAAVQEPAQYNYEYKVADEEAQNYISKTESRDGDTLTGQYSYVDPSGALITVNYEAGPMGYSAVTDKQEGFVDIRPQPAKTSSNGFSGASSTGFTGSSSTGFSGSSSSGFSGSSSTGFSGVSGVSSSSTTVDQSALISEIIASLQPQISSAVQSALSTSSSTGFTRDTNNVGLGRAGGARDLAGTFGDGVSVNIDTPEYNINY